MAPKAAVGKPHRGAIRVQSCSLEDLSALRDDYAQLAYGPLLQSLRAHNNRKPSLRQSTALLWSSCLTTQTCFTSLDPLRWRGRRCRSPIARCQIQRMMVVTRVLARPAPRAYRSSCCRTRACHRRPCSGRQGLRQDLPPLYAGRRPRHPRRTRASCSHSRRQRLGGGTFGRPTRQIDGQHFALSSHASRPHSSSSRQVDRRHSRHSNTEP